MASLIQSSWEQEALTISKIVTSLALTGAILSLALSLRLVVVVVQEFMIQKVTALIVVAG